MSSNRPHSGASSNNNKPIYLGHSVVTIAKPVTTATPVMMGYSPVTTPMSVSTPTSVSSFRSVTTPTFGSTSTSVTALTPVTSPTFAPARAIPQRPTPAYSRAGCAANLRWVKSIFASPGTPAEQLDTIVLPLANWILEPENFKQSIDEVKAIAASLKSTTRILALCQVSDDYYYACLAPTIKDWKLNVLALQELSEGATAHLLSTLVLPHLQVISLMNMDAKALGLIYAKILAGHVSEKYSINVICGEGIPEEWKNSFKLLKDPANHFNIYQRNLPTIVNSWIKSQARNTQLVNEHTGEITNLEERTKNELSVLKEKYKKAKEELHKAIKEQIEKLEERQEVARERKQEIKRLKEEIADLNRVIQALKSKIVEIEKASASQKQAALETASEIDTKNKEAKIELRNEIALQKTLIRELKAKLANLDEVDSFFVTPEQEVKTLKSELDNDKREIIELRDTINRLKLELSKATADLKSQKSKETNHINKINELQSQIAKLTTSVKALEEKNEGLVQQKTVLAQKNSVQAKAIEESEEKIALAQSLSTDYQKSLDEMETDYNSAINDINTAQANSRALELQLAGLNAELEKARESIAELEFKKNYLKKQLRGFQKEDKQDDSDEEHESKKRKREDGKRDRDEEKRMKTVIADLTQKLAEAKSTITFLTAKNQSNEELRAKQGIDYAEMSTNYRRIQRELATEKMQHSGTKRTLNRVTTTLQSVKTEHNTEIATLKAAAKSTQLAHDKKVSELQSLIEFGGGMKTETSPAFPSRYLSHSSSRRGSHSYSPLGSSGLFGSSLTVSPAYDPNALQPIMIPPLDLDGDHTMSSLVKTEFKR
jgi:hypothetical protein